MILPASPPAPPLDAVHGRPATRWRARCLGVWTAARVGLAVAAVLGAWAPASTWAAGGPAQGDKPPAPAEIAAGVKAMTGPSAPPPELGLGGAMKTAVKGAVKGAMGKGKKGAALPEQTDESLEQRLALLRRKTLKDEDFADADDKNRDPFRSFLRMFNTKEVLKAPTVPAIFEKFAFEELQLIAIISGDANPRAMFRDPAGFGIAVKRGDYVSKSAGRVAKILSDRVIIEQSEITPTGESRIAERAILVNPEGPQP
jgi:Tfp pilus assembly protein PilP